MKKHKLRILLEIFLLVVVFLALFSVGWEFIIKITILSFTMYLIGIFLLMTSAKISLKANKQFRKLGSLDNYDFKKNIDYYREILKINSPLILGIVDELEINNNILTAEILYLKYIDAIIINDEKIEKNPEFDEVKLLSSERYILNKIKNGKLNIEDNKLFKETLSRQIIYDLKNKKLTNEKEMKLNRVMICGIISTMIIMILDIILKSIYMDNRIKSIVMFIICVIAGGVLIGQFDLIPYDFSYLKRTEEGKELNKKMEGLKRYLKDYSMLDEKTSDFVEVWDEYLIYSVLFGQNKKIIEEYEKYIKIMK